MKEYFAYLRSRRMGLGLLVLCTAIFGFSFWLYGLPAEAAAYPAVLCAVVLLIAGVLDYLRFQRKQKQLTFLLALPDDLPSQLSDFTEPEEEAFRGIIHALCERDTRQRIEFTKSKTDQMDYYTTWAHQIKTPIAAMRLMQQNEDSAFSRRMGEELQRIEQYVEMVLTYQRLDSESTDYVFREHSIDALVKASLRKFAAQFIGRGIRLEYTPLQGTIVTDEKWFAFVIEQILSNSLKYTPSGSVSITQEGDVLCIRDTGIGILPEDLPRIFEKGYTGTNGRANRKASGLGLYLCRRICTCLGIGIRAESVQGTAIFLDLSQKRSRCE